MIKKSAFKYFQAFAEKDIGSLRTMLAPTVSLRDWDIRADGLDAVITANLNIFNAVKTIVVTPVNVFVDGNTVVAELNIEIDGTELLKVVDILVFDRDGRICAIRAYNG
jgi:ketosteroid isomerase-like protein